MENKKPERDAGDVAPRPDDDKQNTDSAPQHGAGNKDERMDGGRAIPADDLSSANDE